MNGINELLTIAEHWREWSDPRLVILLEALADPEVPILPPHTTVKQAKNLMSSIIEGDPSRGAMIRGAFKDMLASVLPHKPE